jgi:hypothetical protein
MAICVSEFYFEGTSPNITITIEGSKKYTVEIKTSNYVSDPC